MGIKLNLYCNKQTWVNDAFRKNIDQVKWGPGHIERDEFGIPILKRAAKERDKNDSKRMAGSQ